METIVFEKSFSRYNVVSVMLCDAISVIQTHHIVAGRYYMNYEIRNTYLYKQYNDTSERCCLSSFRLWLEESEQFSLESMISLLKFGEYYLAGLVFLAWLKEKNCLREIDLQVSHVEMTADDWGIVLNVLTNNENIRIQ